MFIDEKSSNRVIMDCRTSALTRIMSWFEGLNTQTQFNVLGNRIDLYFHDHKLAIEIDENGHSDSNFDFEIKIQKVMQQELGGKFITIDPDKEEFDIFRIINEVFRHIKQSTNKQISNK